MPEPVTPSPGGADATPSRPATPGPGAPEPTGPALARTEPTGPALARTEPTGPALARAAIDAALAKRRAAPRPGARRGEHGEQGGPESGRRRRGYTGPGPDPRDPQPLASVLDRLVKARGWQRPTAEATVFGAWERVVGPEVASHCRPVKLEQGELTVEAESTAWATQLRLLAGRLITNIKREVGTGVVTRLHIHGPTAPSWSRGPRRVRGRGPRDTYG